MPELRTSQSTVDTVFADVDAMSGQSDMIDGRRSALEAERRSESRSKLDFAVDVMREDFIVTKAMDALLYGEDVDTSVEPDFNPFAEEHKEVLTGLSEENRELLLTDSTIFSRKALEQKASGLLQVQKRRERIADAGMSGLAGRLAMNLVDPAYIVGELAVGKGAMTMGLIAKAGQAGTVRRAVEAAAIGTTAEASIATGRMALDETYDVGDYARDVAFAAVGNGLVGGVAGAAEVGFAKHKLAKVVEMDSEIQRLKARNPELDEDEIVDTVVAGDPELQSIIKTNEDGDYNQYAKGLHLWDSWSQHMKSDSKTERSVAAAVMEDAVGSKGSKVTNHHTAAREAARLDDKWTGSLDRVTFRHFNKYMTATGRARWNPKAWDEAHEELGEQVYRFIIDHDYRPVNAETDAIVKDIAGTMRTQFDDVLADAQRSGVKGAEYVGPDGKYAPRVSDRNLIRKMVQEGRISEKALSASLKRSLQNADGSAFAERADDEMYDLWASKVSDRWVERQLSAGHEFSQTGDDIGDFLEEDYKSILEEVNAKMSKRGEGEQGNWKQKMSLDLRTPLLDDSGRALTGDNGEAMTVFDLFRKNALVNAQVYYKRQAGNIALHKVGIQGRSGFDKLKQKAMSESRSGEQVGNRMDAMYRQIVGMPVHPEFASSDFARYARLANKFNFVGKSGKMFFAAANEYGQSLGRNGLFSVLNRLGDTAKITGLRRNIDNNVEVVEEWMDAIGGLTHGPYRNMFNDFNDAGVVGFHDNLSRMEMVAKRGERAMARMNLLSAVDQSTREMSFMTTIDSFAKAARTGDLSKLPYNPEEMGLEPEMLERIMGHAKRHQVTERGVFGHKTKRMNFDKWTDANGRIDHEAREALGRAMHRVNTKMVQKAIAGETAYLTEHPFFNLLFQFRNFALQAITKHLARDLNNLNDLKTYTAFMATGMMTWATYNARTLLQGVGRDDQEKFYDERLVTVDDFGRMVDGDPASAKRVMSAMRYNPSFGAGYDLMNMFGTMGGSPLPGAFRSTGINNTMLSLDGNPTVKSSMELLTGLNKGLNPDLYQNERERRALLMLLPFSSLTGVENIITRISQETAPAN